MFFLIDLIADTIYDPSGNSNSLFNVDDDILNYSFYMTFLYFSMHSRSIV